MGLLNFVVNRLAGGWLRIGIDLGASNIRAYRRGGLIISEPSLVAVRGDAGEVMEWSDGIPVAGVHARDLLVCKGPPVRFVRPFRGEPPDARLMTAVLRYLFLRAARADRVVS